MHTPFGSVDIPRWNSSPSSLSPVTKIHFDSLSLPHSSGQTNKGWSPQDRFQSHGRLPPCLSSWVDSLLKHLRCPESFIVPNGFDVHISDTLRLSALTFRPPMGRLEYKTQVKFQILYETVPVFYSCKLGANPCPKSCPY